MNLRSIALSARPPACPILARVPPDPFELILGASAAAQAIRDFGRRAAAVDAPVLLLGESGTGKGVMARAIHQASSRARGAFVSVNCAAIADSLFESEFFGHVRGAFTGAQYAHKGLFEQADGGTLFLDEIGDLPMAAQAKLLTVIEDRQVRRVGGERLLPFNARLIAATAADLAERVNEGRFRRDLYHRLRVLHFTLPPLRSRLGDVVLIAEFLLGEFARRYQRPPLAFGDGAIALLESWIWPGNIRELAHAVESAVVASENTTVESIVVDCAQRVTGDPIVLPLPHRKDRYSYAGTSDEEKRVIESALVKCCGNKTHAAALLGMSRNTLLNKLRRFDGLE